MLYLGRASQTLALSPMSFGNIHISLTLRLTGSCSWEYFGSSFLPKDFFPIPMLTPMPRRNMRKDSLTQGSKPRKYATAVLYIL